MMPEFKIIQERPLFTRKESTVSINVSEYTEIKLINNPKFKYVISFPVIGGTTFFYPYEIRNLKFYLNEKEVWFPTDTIEHFYIELYKLIHNEYIKSLLDEL